MQPLLGALERTTERVERRDRRCRHGNQQRIEREPVRAGSVGRRGRDHQRDREQAAIHARWFGIRTTPPSLPSPHP